MSIESLLKKKQDIKTPQPVLTSLKSMVEGMVIRIAKEFFSRLKPELLETIKKEMIHITTVVKKGDKGDGGVMGLQGISGMDGERGKDGKNIKGDRGDDGKLGKDGKQGSPDTPEQIVTKINTLNEKIELSSIKGFKQFERNIIRVVRERKVSKGGGGMGNVVHQQFIGDGSTTDFTLSSNVAAGGNAVMACRYQGQVQYLGDQFTISGTTLTMTFTPESGTTIEITYIRT